jgi:hypothetical protein
MYSLSLKVRNRSKKAQQLKIKTSWKTSEILQLAYTPGEVLPGNDRRIDIQLSAPKVASNSSELQLAETLWLETDKGVRAEIAVTGLVLTPQVWGKGGILAGGLLTCPPPPKNRSLRSAA